MLTSFAPRFSELPYQSKNKNDRNGYLKPLKSIPPSTLVFLLFYLNRTNRSGILGGGAIGGTEQNGEYDVSSRFNKDELIRRIQRLKLYRDRISVFNMDAVDFMRSQV